MEKTDQWKIDREQRDVVEEEIWSLVQVKMAATTQEHSSMVGLGCKLEERRKEWEKTGFRALIGFVDMVGTNLI